MESIKNNNKKNNSGFSAFEFVSLEVVFGTLIIVVWYLFGGISLKEALVLFSTLISFFVLIPVLITFLKKYKNMFWKIFAWVNLFVNLPLLGIAVFYTATSFLFVDFLIILVNDLMLLLIPFLFAYSFYNIKYLNNEIFLKTILIFTILYNMTNITRDLIEYNFTSTQGVFLDLFFYSIIVLSITSFVSYIMNNFKISLKNVFLK